MKILIIADRYPLPPKDGVSIPVAGIINLLKSEHAIDLLIIESEGKQDTKSYTGGDDGFGRIISVHATKKRPILGLIEELFLSKPYFCHQINLEDLPNSDQQYDLVISSPINTLAAGLLFKNGGNKLVALISDVYTSVLSERKWQLHETKELIISAVQKLRSKWVAGIENKILHKVDFILVQTSKDAKWLSKISKNTLNEKCLVFTNGVDERLFSNKITQGSKVKTVLYIANFKDSHYRSLLKWFYEDVWLSLRKKNVNTTLRIVGRGINEDQRLHERLMNDISIEYHEYIEDLSFAYNGANVAVAPIFKSYGFINKVGEALAAGVPVVGDSSAFNGIEEVLDIGGGFAANTADEFISCLEDILDNDIKCLEISKNARLFAKQNLRWASREAIVQKILNPF
jgi:glycosyltransferase involved in cell wall biosynthesis